MIGVLPWVVVVASVVLTLVVLVHVVLDRTPDWGLLALAGFVEAATLLVTVIASVQVLGGDRDLAGEDAATLVGYLLTALLVLPLAFVWSLAERSRGATAALAVASATVAFMAFRAIQIWG